MITDRSERSEPTAVRRRWIGPTSTGRGLDRHRHGGGAGRARRALRLRLLEVKNHQAPPGDHQHCRDHRLHQGFWMAGLPSQHSS